MILNGVLVFAVFIVVILFLYLSFKLKRDAEKVITYEGRYEIALSKDFAGQSLSIYVNDSLLMNGILPDSLVVLDIDRFAEEHALMIVNNETDATTPFNLHKEGSKVTVKKTDNGIVFEETPARF